jgi:hypothetical protein
MSRSIRGFAAAIKGNSSAADRFRIYVGFHLASRARKNLTRRANHRHIVIVATIEPAPGNRSRAFSIAILQPIFCIGRRPHLGRSISHVSALSQDACKRAAVRTSVGDQPHGFVAPRLTITREFNMTAYLISLALAGLLALALWEAMS